jgi:hypothetical protein
VSFASAKLPPASHGQKHCGDDDQGQFHFQRVGTRYGAVQFKQPVDEHIVQDAEQAQRNQRSVQE